MIDASIIQSSKQAHGQHIMNRFCVICDRYTPSHLRMTWHEDEGGYCCPSCAEAELLKIRDDDYFEDDGELESA